jgi:outer membrane immunogenic protein
VLRVVVASLVGAGLSIGFGGMATAADLSAPPAALPYSWSGFYAGLEGGYGWSDPTVTATGNDAFSTAFLTDVPVGPVSFNNTGGFGGLEAGYNWQLGRSWLAGIETDFSGSDIKGQGTTEATLTGFVATNPQEELSANQKISWFGTVRPRLGWLATDSLLLYGTGGFAYGRVSESVNYGVSTTSPGVIGLGFGTPAGTLICPNGSTCFSGTSDRITTGWTAGAGAEYRIPGTSASFKVEYLFVDLGSGDVVNAVSVPNVLAGTAAKSSFSAAYSDTEFHTVKAGFNWHF